MKIVTNVDFEAEVLKSDKPVLVFFSADWSRQCNELSPSLEILAKEKTDCLKIVKVDFDASPDLAALCSVDAIPAFLMLRDGDIVFGNIGGSPMQILDWVYEALALSAGATLDLTPKEVVLSDNDKKRLRAAFEEAVNKSPDATLREEVEKGLSDGHLFKVAAAFMTSTQMTVDEYINTLRKQGLLPANRKPTPEY